MNLLNLSLIVEITMEIVWNHVCYEEGNLGHGGRSKGFWVLMWLTWFLFLNEVVNMVYELEIDWNWKMGVRVLCN